MAIQVQYTLASIKKNISGWVSGSASSSYSDQIKYLSLMQSTHTHLQGLWMVKVLHVYPNADGADPVHIVADPSPFLDENKFRDLDPTYTDRNRIQNNKNVNNESNLCWKLREERGFTCKQILIYILKDYQLYSVFNLFDNLPFFHLITLLIFYLFSTVSLVFCNFVLFVNYMKKLTVSHQKES